MIKLQKKGFEVLYIAGGDDMSPSISPHEKLLLEKVSSPSVVNLGDVIVFKRGILIAHRVLGIIRVGTKYFFLTRGDRCPYLDLPVSEQNIVGRIVGKSRQIFPLFRRSVALRVLLLAYLGDSFFSGRFRSYFLLLLRVVSKRFL